MLDLNLLGSGYRILKILPVSPVLTWYIRRLVAIATAKGEFHFLQLVFTS